MKNLTKTLCLAALLLPTAAQAQVTSLEIAPLVVSETLPEGWSGHQQPHLNRIAGSHRVIEESGQPILQLQKDNYDTVMAVSTEAAIPAGNKMMNVHLTSRVPEIGLPEENPGRNRFRLNIGFYDEKGTAIPGQYPQIAYGRVSHDWKTDSNEYEIPEKAASVRATFTLLNCTGIWEIQELNIDVTP